MPGKEGKLPDLNAPPLHDGEQVESSFDEHGSGLQITPPEVHKGLLCVAIELVMSMTRCLLTLYGHNLTAVMPDIHMHH